MTTKPTTTPTAAPAPAAPKAPKKLNVATLRRLIADIEANNSQLARQGLIDRLFAEEKFRTGTRNDGTGATFVKLAGLEASSSAGMAAALSNWCNAARRKIIEAEAA